MIKLLKYRAALISIMFGLFGGALSKLLDIDEMAGYYTALASLIALVVSLLISFLLKGTWKRAVRNNVKIISIVLFFGLIVTIYMHTKYFIECTFQYKDFDGHKSYYVNGSEYTEQAKKFKRNNPQIQSDDDLIREGFGSPAEKSKVWTPDSIQKNVLKLITSYSLLVIFFVSIISILLEVLTLHYGRSTAKSF
ncbi:hypothetical protein GS399_05000 [Pedobacter sp. HMF7647]|uniref:DUF4199 family protein n=1 Tax=Hufsiella arboris TaxID=2695275 RepID=A0A7K1Y7D3_9SPHI|nr:hypothetical protein [Hufsiella arboris]MXV50321.1 hypothetical protein [Hufsiella arboris]